MGIIQFVHPSDPVLDLPAKGLLVYWFNPVTSTLWCRLAKSNKWRLSVIHNKGYHQTSVQPTRRYHELKRVAAIMGY